jgi:hypothetical protein
MDFITRDQLVTAMHAWVLDKTKQLGQLLGEQRVLSPERRQLLEALAPNGFWGPGRELPVATDYTASSCKEARSWRSRMGRFPDGSRWPEFLQIA